MLKKAIIALATIAALGVSSMPSAYAINMGQSRNFKVSRQATVPVAFSLYCLKHIEECRPSAQSQVAYTSKVRGLLASVNRSVNRSIRPVRESNDVWTLNPRQGDCDDYAVTKRSRLIRAGIPSGALRIAVVRTRSGEGHAVLLVKTNAGEFALDNLRQTIVKRSQTGYRYVSVASANPMRWTR
ncbi:putative transglutaminase-like cysteine proteinase [Pararhizobium capsulatum DSM 1112]|uniref:Transglutaminase-like cysteine proteinase n=1 Tax=Pararhizobium capsulatum DSM 1112 TaxID=1121113 RepID=A0ABU0BKJ2_9HYPH|nr:transglutaminase-like cysteine peptidase [Pararhizobium capsulatum]MDQ0318413.1 putative transglutaminase-like cysteine proteinase [Pararhizobium capsulatum DSM 1112]